MATPQVVHIATAFVGRSRNKRLIAGLSEHIQIFKEFS
jgi:hypothetical protein